MTQPFDGPFNPDDPMYPKNTFVAKVAHGEHVCLHRLEELTAQATASEQDGKPLLAFILTTLQLATTLDENGNVEVAFEMDVSGGPRKLRVAAERMLDTLPIFIQSLEDTIKDEHE